MVLAIIIWLCILILLYTFFGYPLLAFLVAKIFPRPVQSLPIFPPITMVIPAHNEADVIERKLTNTLEIDYPRELFEVLVLDDGSEDGTAEIIEGFVDQGITLLRQIPRQGKMAAVNRGVREARGKIIMLSDASPDYVPGAIKSAVRHFADTSVGVVSGQIRIWDSASAVEKPAGLYWKYQEKIRQWESRSGSTVGVNGNFFMFRKELYRPPPTTTVNDEFTIAMSIAQQGYRVLYEPEAVTYDDASASMSDEFSRRARINAGRYQALFGTSFLSLKNPKLAFRLISHKLSRPLAPVFMIVLFIASLIRVILIPPPNGLPTLGDILLISGWAAWVIFWVQQLIYGLALLGWLFETQGWGKVRLFSIPYFFMNGNLAALVGLYRYLTGGQAVTWKKRTTGEA